MDPLTRSRRSAPSSRRRVLLFCQHPVARQRILRWLNRTSFDVTPIPELRLADSVVRSFGAAPPGLAVIDSAGPDATLEFIRSLRLQVPQLSLLVLLPALDESVACPLLRLGVKGLVAYDQAPRELGDAIGRLADGAYCVPSELLAHFIESILPELHGCKTLASGVEISRREREVLDLLLENLSNKEIAARLFVSERTIKFHVSNLLSKFHAQRRAELIIHWLQRSRDLPWRSHDVGNPLSPHIN